MKASLILAFTKALLVFAVFLNVLVILLYSHVSVIYALSESLLIILIIVFSERRGFIIRVTRRIGIDLVGFLLPLIFSLEVFIRNLNLFGSILSDFLIALLLAVIVNYLNSMRSPVHGVILLDLIVPLLFTSGVVSVIVLRNGFPLVYSFIFGLVIGCFSSIIGLDILNIKLVEGKVYVLGGNKLFDAVFLETFLSPSMSFAFSILAHSVL
ncbi:MAG: hypothetical protein DRO16_03980 [Thermoprotei archaeon]|nr:MAG: hypothetical protein DRO16_03980 [Thermoprotei archaeon]